MGIFKESVRTGQLNCVATIKKYTDGTDEDGFPAKKWVDFKTLRCKTEFDNRAFKESFTKGGIDTIVGRIFTFRYFEGLTERDRIYFKGIPYEVIAYDDLDDKREYLVVWGMKIAD